MKKMLQVSKDKFIDPMGIAYAYFRSDGTASIILMAQQARTSVTNPPKDPNANTPKMKTNLHVRAETEYADSVREWLVAMTNFVPEA